jgi:hypothetical protein
MIHWQEENPTYLISPRLSMADSIIQVGAVAFLAIASGCLGWLFGFAMGVEVERKDQRRNGK